MPGGRPKGALNKATADVKLLAQVYTAPALKTLAQIMKHGESEQARVAAARELLDRGHGKARQEIGDAATSDTVNQVNEEVSDIVLGRRLMYAVHCLMRKVEEANKVAGGAAATPSRAVLNRST